MALAAGVPPWFVTLLAGVAAVAAYLAYWRTVAPLSAARRAALTALRLATLLLLLLFLLEPIASQPRPAPAAVVPVLLDDSRSMRLPAGRSGRRRIDRAAALLREEVLPALTGRFDVDLVTFDGLRASIDRAGPDVDPAAVAPTAPASDLPAALQALAERHAGRTVAGVVLLSDGGDTSGRDLARAVDGAAGPVYAIGVGIDGPAPDREVTNLTVGDASVAGSVVELSADVVVRGGLQDAGVVRLFKDGRLLDVRRVRSAGDGVPARVVFRVSPGAAVATRYTVEAAAHPAEAVVENNRRSLLVQPPARPRRVLMIEGAPGHEHSFLKRAWLADAGLAVDAVVRKGRNADGRDTFYVQGDPDRTAALATGFPRDRAALFRYDALVLANVEGGFFRPAQQELAAAFVAERGGGLLVLGATALTGAGLRGSALEPLLPLDLSDRGRPVSAAGRFTNRNRLLLTEEGARHPVMQLAPTSGETRQRWRAAPALAGSTPLGAARPGASVLARVGRPEGGSSPLVAVQRYGRGRSMVFAGEASWRWKMLLPAGSRTYDTFWGQAARWLAGPAPERLTLSVTPGRLPGDAAEIGLQVLDAEHRPQTDARPTVEVTTPAGAVRTLDARLADAGAGRYTARFRAAADGVYRVEARAGPDLAPAAAWFLAGGSDVEFTSPWSNGHVLERLAAATGGRLLPAGELQALPGLLRAAAPAPAPGVRELWHGAWSFFLVLTLLVAEWSLRRAWGLR